MTPQSLVLSRCDDNKERGGKTNVVLVGGYGQFFLIYLYALPKPLPMVSV